MAVIVAAMLGVGGMCGSAMGQDAAHVDAGQSLGLVELVLLAAFPVVLWWLWRADVIRPGSLARHRKRDVTGSPWSIWWVGVLLMLFAQAAGGAVGVMLAGQLGAEGVVGEGGPGAGWTEVAAALGGGAAGLAVGLWLMWLLGGGTWGLKTGLDLRVRGRDLAVGLIGFLSAVPIVGVATIVSVLVSQAITGRVTDPLAHETLKTIYEDPGSVRTWGLILAAVVLAPMVEEILFRGLLQSGFLRLSRRVWPSVLAASVVFAAVHISAVGESVHALAPLFVFGVCLGVAYERTGRLWVPMVMHMLFNGVNIALTLAA